MSEIKNETRRETREPRREARKEIVSKQKLLEAGTYFGHRTAQ